MDIKPEQIALRTDDFYKSYDITVKTDKEVRAFDTYRIYINPTTKFLTLPNSKALQMAILKLVKVEESCPKG